MIKLTDTAKAVVKSFYPLTSGIDGKIDYAGAVFLLSVIERERPKFIVEIGVGSGASSLLIHKLLEAIGHSADLWSIDLADYFLGGSKKRQIGFLVNDVYGTRPDNWHLLTKYSSVDLARLGSVTADLAFIDGNHAHPWPAIDTMMCCFICRPYSWLVLHDVALPRLQPKFQQWGAVHVFDGWKGLRHFAPGGNSNIGAIRTSDSPYKDVSSLQEIIRNHHWEARIGPTLFAKINGFLTLRKLPALVTLPPDPKPL